MEMKGLVVIDLQAISLCLLLTVVICLRYRHAATYQIRHSASGPK